MKCYKLKEPEFSLKDYEELVPLEDPDGDYIPTYKRNHCRSIEELRNAIYLYNFEGDPEYETPEETEKYMKVVDEIISKIGVEEYEVELPDCSGIVIKIEELEDQYECGAIRIPTLYLKSLTELENLNFDYLYEIWKINEDNTISVVEELSTYSIYSD